MKQPENHNKPLWTESRVASLLEDFYRKEIPAALREPHPTERISLVPARTVSLNPIAKTRANSFAGLLMVGCSSLLLLMLAFLVSNNSHPPSVPANGLPTTAQADKGSATDHRGEDSLDALKHQGQGPIEMRPRVHNVGTHEGSNSEVSPFPELDIEVYPLDRETPAKAEPGPSRRPAPMPEEHRPLPESESPAPAKPEEPRAEPLLPELQTIPDYSSGI